MEITCRLKVLRHCLTKVNEVNGLGDVVVETNSNTLVLHDSHYVGG